MNYTILIVDDDMAINDMLVKYLRKNGYITINEQIQNIAQKKDTLCRRMYN